MKKILKQIRRTCWIDVRLSERHFYGLNIFMEKKPNSFS